MNTESTDTVARATFLARVCVGTLCLGILGFAITVLVIRNIADPRIEGMEIITYIGIGLLVVAVASSVVLLPLIDAQVRKRLQPQSTSDHLLLEAFQSRTMTGCALIEASAFICLLGAILDGRQLGVIVGLIAAVVMILLYFPSTAKVQAYIDTQRNLAAGENQN